MKRDPLQWGMVFNFTYYSFDHWVIAVCHFADYYENVGTVGCVGYLGTGIGFRRSIFSFLSELIPSDSENNLGKS